MQKNCSIENGSFVITTMASHTPKPVRRLKTTVKIEPLSDDDDVVSCKVCTKTFCNEVALRNHARIEHVEAFASGDPTQWTGSVEPTTPSKKRKLEHDDISNKNNEKDSPDEIELNTEKILSSMTAGNLMNLASNDVSYISIKTEENLPEDTKERRIIKMKDTTREGSKKKCPDPITKMKSIRDILIFSATSASPSKTVVDRLQDIIMPIMPQGWTDWTIQDVNIEDIAGDPPDSKIINKLRYAIPTLDMAKAFDLTELTRKGYKDIKLKMLRWPFTRALIYSPLSLASQIHGNNLENVLNAARSIKPHLLSREETDLILRGPLPLRRRSKAPVKPPSQDPLADALKKQTEMFKVMMQKMVAASTSSVDTIVEVVNSIRKRESNAAQPPPTDCTYATVAEADSLFSEMEINSEDESGENGNCDETAVLTQNRKEQGECTAMLTFEAITTAAEPTIPAASEDMVTKAKDCQRLGSDTWNNIRYREAEKSLHGTPIFTALKVNPQLTSITPKWCKADVLQKFDQTLGVLTHALLLQRKAMEEGIQQVVKEVKSPILVDSIQRNLLAKDSSFRRTSDQALQYVCGRRADVIATRRTSYTSPNIGLDSILQSIPPSTSHLYDEEKICEVFMQYGGFYKFFPPKRHELRQKTNQIRRKPPRRTQNPSKDQPKSRLRHSVNTKKR